MDKRRFGKRWTAARVAATKKRNADKRAVRDELKRLHQKHFPNSEKP